VNSGRVGRTLEATRRPKADMQGRSIYLLVGVKQTSLFDRVTSDFGPWLKLVTATFDDSSARGRRMPQTE
jgi:hypothetical protein